MREYGFDFGALSKKTPNLILSTTLILEPTSISFVAHTTHREKLNFVMIGGPKIKIYSFFG